MKGDQKLGGRKDESKEELRAELEGRRVVRRFITPTLVLCQLHVGTIDRDKIIDHIMQYDAYAIDEAIKVLMERGLS